MSRLRRIVEELGLVGSVCYLVNRLVGKVSRYRPFYYYSIVAQPVAQGRIRTSGKYSTRVVESLEELPGIYKQLAKPLSVIQDRFAQGSRCILLHKDTVVVAYAWIAPDGYIEDEVRCRYELSPAEITAWDFDIYVFPEHRSTLAFARLWDAVNGHLSASGRKWTLSRISRFNTASISSHQRMGATTVATALFLVAGKFQLLMSRSRPFVHVSFTDNSMPVLRFDVGNGPGAG